MTLPLLDLTLPTLAENLALDEALLLEAEEGNGGEVLRFWEWPDPAVVLGAGGQLAAEIHEDLCRRDGVPLQRRASGGGTVLLGSGCLLFSLVLRFDRDPVLKDVNASYRFILGHTAAALAPVADAELVGISDLAVARRKFSGNAQQRKREHVLHHGTLLYDFDLGLIGRYLRPPKRQPAYREGRSHEAFVLNLPADADTLKRLLRSVWDAKAPKPALPLCRIAALVAEKYDTEEWIRRR
jgi:lipoate-protein ligase A